MMQQGMPGLGDREIAEDLLSTEKFMTDLYNKATIESADPGLRNTFRQIQGNVQENAKRVFDYLNSKGWYRITPADQQMLEHLNNTITEARQATGGVPVEHSYRSPYSTSESPSGGYYTQPGYSAGETGRYGPAGGYGQGQIGGYGMNPYGQQSIYQNPYLQSQGIYQGGVPSVSQGMYGAGQSGLYQSPYYGPEQLPEWTKSETFGPPGTRYTPGYGMSPYQQGYQMGYGGGYGSGLPGWAQTETFGPPGTRYGIGSGYEASPYQMGTQPYQYSGFQVSPYQYQGGFGGGYGSGLPGWARTETFGPPGTRYGGGGSYSMSQSSLGGRPSPYGHIGYGSGLYGSPGGYQNPYLG